MKIGIISDIHGRLLSLVKVMQQLQDMDAIFNLGDIAGFEPDVNKCYDLLKEKKIVNLLGNHEFEAISKSDSASEYYPSDSEDTPLAPDFGVNPENKAFIRQFKLMAKVKLDGIKYTFCHGFPIKHNGQIFFDYLSDENIMELSHKQESAVFFCGHIHRPQIITAKQGQYEILDEVEEGRTITIEEGIIYGFNVGMLSKSMDDPEKLQYCTLDTIKKKVNFVFT